MDTFTIILNNLVLHGVPDALERANEIEAEIKEEVNKVKMSKDIDKDLYFKAAFKACLKYYPSTSELGVKSKSRKKQFVMVRKIVTWLLKNNTDMTLNDIGMLLGGRDHTTQIWALKSLENFFWYDKLFKKMVEDINQNFKLMINNVV